MKKKKGFTLIEIILSLAIMSLVLMTIYLIFVSNYRQSNEINTTLKLQGNGEKTLNYMVNKIIDSHGIYKVINKEGKEVTNLKEENNIKNIIFYTEKSEDLEKSGVICFVYENNILKYGEGTVENLESSMELEEASKNIAAFKIKPIGESFYKAKGVEINLTVEEKGISREYKTKVYFRNK